MSTQQAAYVEALLEGVPLPATKETLLAYAREQDGGAEAAQLLERIPDREYEALDDVGEELAPAQPESGESDAELPRDESGDPPGGDEYLDPDPESGAVREDAPPDNPAQKQIEEASRLLKEQQQKQESG